MEIVDFTSPACIISTYTWTGFAYQKPSAGSAVEMWIHGVKPGFLFREMVPVFQNRRLANSCKLTLIPHLTAFDLPFLQASRKGLQNGGAFNFCCHEWGSKQWPDLKFTPQSLEQDQIRQKKWEEVASLVLQCTYLMTKKATWLAALWADAVVLFAY